MAMAWSWSWLGMVDILTTGLADMARDNEDNELLPPTQLVATRILKYSDAQIYASLQEEKSLNDDMRQDLVLQMLRRLSAINPKLAH